jgi:hypothetical protein
MPGIFYSMGLNPAQFVGGLGQANAALAGTKSSIAGMAGTVAKLTAAFAAAGAAAAGMAAFKGLKLAADFEKTEVGMNTIIKNLQVTRGLIGQLQALAAKTPLELPDLTGGARTMLGAGWNLGDVVGDLKMFGDVASGAQTDLLGLVQVIAQVKGKGRLMAEELLQFSERGVAGLRQALEKVKGFTPNSTELSKAMEKGQISVQDFMAALRSMTVEGGIFFNAMQNQSRTTYGLLSTLKDTVNQIFLAFGRPLNDAIKPMLDGAIKLAEQLAAKAANVVTAWSIAFANGKLGELLWDQLRVGLAKAGNYAAAVFEGLGAGIQAALGTMDGFFNPTLWQAVGNYLELGLIRAANAFLAEMYEGLINLNHLLPKAMKMDEAALGRGSVTAQARGMLAKTGMAEQGAEIARYLETQNIGASIGRAIKAAVAGFKAGRASSSGPFDAKPGAVTRDAETAARIKRNNDALAQKKEFDKATQASGGGGWVNNIGKGISAFIKGSMKVEKAGDAAATALGKVATAADAVAGGPPDEGGRRRIKGYSFRRQGGAAAARARAGQRGARPSGLNSQYLPGGPLDYLYNRKIQPYQPTKTTNQRAKEAADQTLNMILQGINAIAANTAGLKVV